MAALYFRLVSASAFGGIVTELFPAALQKLHLCERQCLLPVFFGSLGREEAEVCQLLFCCVPSRGVDQVLVQQAV